MENKAGTRGPQETGFAVVERRRAVRRTHGCGELLRTMLILLGFLLAWRFLSGIVTVVLVLLMGLLLAVALSGPVEALHRRKVPRPLATRLVCAGALAAWAWAVVCSSRSLRTRSSNCLSPSRARSTAWAGNSRSWPGLRASGGRVRRSRALHDDQLGTKASGRGVRPLLPVRPPCFWGC